VIFILIIILKMKSVRFSNVNDIFLIPAIPDATKIIVPDKNTYSYSDEELKTQIKVRKEAAWKQVRQEYIILDRQYKDLKKCILEAKENDEDELDIFYEMMFLNLVYQELCTRKMIYLKIM